ncbi:MAG: hypothetical protein GY801_42635 [bacterium]|nr:hypothetical protein [bacterium]
MARLSETEKQELLELAQSAELRKDMEILRKNREEIMYSADEYIEFLDRMNAMNGHKTRPFRKIDGEFLL